MTLEEYRYFLGMGKKQKLNNMVLQRKIRLPDTQFLQNEYLRASFFPIDPYSPFYTLFAANLVSHNTFFLHRPKTQNAHGGRNVMPRCLSEGVDIFLKSADRQGESGHDVRVSRSAPWMARVGDPVMMRTTVSLFIRKFTPGDATSRRDVPFAVGVRGFA